MIAARFIATIIIISATVDLSAAQSPTKPLQRPIPRAAPATADNYCVSGSAGFLTSEEQGVEAVRSKCKRGDTVIIPATKARIIARLCDFTKTAVTADGNVVCVLTGTDRPER